MKKEIIFCCMLFSIATFPIFCRTEIIINGKSYIQNEQASNIQFYSSMQNNNIKMHISNKCRLSSSSFFNDMTDVCENMKEEIENDFYDIKKKKKIVMKQKINYKESYPTKQEVITAFTKINQSVVQDIRKGVVESFDFIKSFFVPQKSKAELFIEKVSKLPQTTINNCIALYYSSKNKLSSYWYNFKIKFIKYIL